MCVERLRVPVVILLALLPGLARAHFVLDEPAAMSEQDAFGGPQKSAPCGLSDPGNSAEMTNDVTTYRAGQTITVTVSEVIYHPGHYRVLIAPDMASLPEDPPVTAGSTPCGSTTIDDTPELPLLADGLLQHDSAMVGPRSVDVKLPDGFTCTNCVLQVVEFMSNHELNNPGGCYYHHCATVSVVADDGSPTTNPGPSCAASAGGASWLVVALLLVRRRNPA